MIKKMVVIIQILSNFICWRQMLNLALLIIYLRQSDLASINDQNDLLTQSLWPLGWRKDPRATLLSGETDKLPPFDCFRPVLLLLLQLLLLLLLALLLLLLLLDFLCLTEGIHHSFLPPSPPAPLLLLLLLPPSPAPLYLRLPSLSPCSSCCCS